MSEVQSNAENYLNLKDQVQQLSLYVEKLADRMPGVDQAGAIESAAQTCSLESQAVNAARQGIKLRRQRAKLFGVGLFAEPGWDILLELYVARADDYEVTVGNACIAASVPMSSALRWCQMLEDRGIVHRYHDTADRRRRFLKLSDCAYEKMNRLMVRFVDQ